ncbi:MAG: hypothetical protein ACLPKI_27335 [Streptosporangiaceae bacterium]
MRTHRAASLAGLALTALLAAACSGGAKPAGSGASPGPGRAQQLDVFAQCMRSHGERDFYLSNPSSNPSPGTSSDGDPVLGVMGYVVYGINPQVAPFPAAMQACKHLLPGGGPPPPTRKQIDSMVRFAACMRAHGYPDYPDPIVRNGGIEEQPLPSSIDTSSAQFQAADKTCSTSS